MIVFSSLSLSLLQARNLQRMSWPTDQIRENADKAHIMDHLVKRSLPANEGRCMHTQCSHEANTCDQLCAHAMHGSVSVTSKIQQPFWNSRGLVPGETRSPYPLANVLRSFSVMSACYVWYIIRCVRTQDLRVPSEEAILFIDIPNSRGLVPGETRSPYLLANVSREQLTFRTGLCLPKSGPNLRPKQPIFRLTILLD